MLTAPAAPQQERLDAEQQRMLGKIDTKIAAKAVDLAGKLAEYRKAIADFRKDIDEAKKTVAAKEAAALRKPNALKLYSSRPGMTRI